MATAKNHVYTNVADQNQLSAEHSEFYARTLLERLIPELMLTKYGEKSIDTSIPKRNGMTISWRRFNSIKVGNHELVEGVTPDSIDATVSKINATVQQYGAYLQTTDLLDTVALDPVVTEFTEVLGEHGGLAIETIVRDIITSGSNVMYAGGVEDSTGAMANKITALDLLKIRRTFKRNHVKPISLPNGKKGYLLFAHTDVVTDLMQTEEWKNVNTFVDTKNYIEGVAGQLYGVYVVEYDLTENADGLYKNFAIGKGAFGVVDINGSSKPQIIVKSAGSSGTNDPLNQRSTIGWKALMTAVRLQELAIIRYETGASV